MLHLVGLSKVAKLQYIPVYKPPFYLALFVENADYSSDFSFFQDQRSDRFYKRYKLASTNCHTNVASSASNFLRIF